MAERTAEDRALTFMLGAWAGWVLDSNAHNVRFVAKPMISKIAGIGTWRALRDGEWTVEHGDNSIAASPTLLPGSTGDIQRGPTDVTSDPEVEGPHAAQTGVSASLSPAMMAIVRRQPSFSRDYSK